MGSILHHTLTEYLITMRNKKMNVNFIIAPLTFDHILEFEFNVRPEDAAECILMHGSVHESVSYSIHNSQKSFVVLDKYGIVCAIYGYGFNGDGTTTPWFLSTDSFPEIARSFSKWGKGIIQDYVKFNRPVVGYVDSRYTKAVRWLEWLGFTINRDTNLENLYHFSIQ